MAQFPTTPTTPSTEHIVSKKKPLRPSLSAIKVTLSRVKTKVNFLSPKSPPRAFERVRIFPFFRLPREVREKIYTLLFKQVIPTRLIVSSSATIPLPRLPDLCYTSWRMYIESVPHVLHHTEIILLDVVSVQDVLKYLNHGHNSTLAQGIMSIKFSSAIAWKPHTTHTTRALLEKCVNVRHVKISVPAAVCVQWFGNSEVQVKSKYQVIEGADYCCLMDCADLKKVSLVCVGGETEARVLGVPVDAVFEPVASWVRENVCKGPGKVLVVEHVKGIGMGGS